MEVVLLTKEDKMKALSKMIRKLQVFLVVLIGIVFSFGANAQAGIGIEEGEKVSALYSIIDGTTCIEFSTSTLVRKLCFEKGSEAHDLDFRVVEVTLLRIMDKIGPLSWLTMHQTVGEVSISLSDGKAIYGSTGFTYREALNNMVQSFFIPTQPAAVKKKKKLNI